MGAPTIHEAEVTRRRSAAYFFAVGVFEEQRRVWREAGSDPTMAPLDRSDEFANWHRQQAVEMYITQTRHHLQSVPDAWVTFLKERAVAPA